MNTKLPLGVGALSLVALMSGAPAAQANTDTQVTIIDGGHYLNSQDNVSQQIKDKSFPDGMNFAVLVSDDSSLTADGYDAKVKKYAMDHLPASLVNKKANDLNPKVMLITISPEIHKMGLYGGKETGINSAWVESAIDAMRPFAQASNWDDMAVQGAESVSENAAPTTESSSADDPSTYTGDDPATDFTPPASFGDTPSSDDGNNLPLWGGLGLGGVALLGAGGVFLGKRHKAKEAQALQALYARQGDWQREWRKRYSRATEDEFSQLRSSTGKARGHLRPEDVAKLENAYNEALAEARSINGAVLSGGKDVKTSLDELNALNNRTRERISSLAGSIHPIGTPSGFTPRSGFNSNGFSTVNPYDVMGLFWISQSMQHNSMMQNNSMMNNNSNSGGTMNGGGGGFSGGSGSW